MVVVTQLAFHNHALQMAHTQADYLVHNMAQLPADIVVPQAAQLILDCVYHLHLPALAVNVALQSQSIVERWAVWTAWMNALDVLLALPEATYAIGDRIHLLHHRNHLACDLGDHATATTVAQTALRLAQALGDHVLIALSLHEVALAAYSGDDLRNAQAYWARAYDTRSLVPQKVAHVSMNLGLIAEQQGRFEEALHYFGQALHYYQVQHDLLHVAKVQGNIGNVQVKQGAYEQAIATFGLAATALYSLGTYYEYALNQNSIGYGYLSGGWYDQAQAVFIFAIQTFDKIGSLSGKALALSNLGELYVTTQQWPQAETTLREAQELALACAKPLLGAAIDVDRGRMLAAHGNTEAARQVWQSALTVQEAKGALQAAQHTRQLLASLFHT